LKLLFDENLSSRLIGALADQFPKSSHVNLVGLAGATDLVIWAYARDQGFTVVSKDDDFRSLSLVNGAPPKVIWLRIGNASTAGIEFHPLGAGQDPNIRDLTRGIPARPVLGYRPGKRHFRLGPRMGPQRFHQRHVSNWSGRQDSNLRPLAPHGFQSETKCNASSRFESGHSSKNTVFLSI
jgi:predicted nuclease of predicted toxin-antitoxin system